MLKPLTNVCARRAAGYAAVLLGLPFLSPQVVLAQCAMCRRALLSPEGQQMVAAFRSGILFLLITPFAVFATIAVLAVRAQRRRADAGWCSVEPLSSHQKSGSAAHSCPR